MEDRKSNSFIENFIFNKYEIIRYSILILFVGLVQMKIAEVEGIQSSVPILLVGFEKELFITKWVIKIIPFISITYMVSIFIEKVLKGNFEIFKIRYERKDIWYRVIERTSLKAAVLYTIITVIISIILSFLGRLNEIELYKTFLVSVFRLFDAIVFTELFLVIAFLFQNVLIGFWIIFTGYLLLLFPNAPLVYPFGLSSYGIHMDKMFELNRIIVSALIYLFLFLFFRFTYYKIIRRL